MITLLKYAGILGSIYLLLVVLMVIFQDRLLFMPDKKYYSPSDVGVSAYTEITVTTSDNIKLKGWYAEAQPGKQTILFFHGNASTWQWRAKDFEPLIQKGHGVLLAGYRGYGGNAGKPSEAGFYQDAEAYLAYLQSRQLPLSAIVLYGESLGTGVAVEMATRYKSVGGLILEAPYASIAETAAMHYPFVPFIRSLIRNRFDSIYKIGSVTAPKLVMVAADDRVIAPADGKRIFEYAPTPKALKVYERTSHNDIRAMGGLPDVATFLTAINN
ncbi:MAG: alpha/beta hydrolase [Proteobacteria bacterium]|nr:alpha/beta hydrolase [Pseudomonadota bacterium]